MATATGSAVAPTNGSMRQFTVDEYMKMIQAGILTQEDPVELIEGWVMLKMPRNHPHDGTIEILDELLQTMIPSGWRVRIQLGLRLPDSVPEPDCVVAQGVRGTYLRRHPEPKDVSLVVEVADSTLAFDRNEKCRVYARADIPCYWIINVGAQLVEVYTDPTGPDAAPAYRQRQDYHPGDAVPLVLGGQMIATLKVQDLLP